MDLAFIGNRDGYTIAPKCKGADAKQFWITLRAAGFTDREFYYTNRREIDNFAARASAITQTDIAVCECLF